MIWDYAPDDKKTAIVSMHFMQNPSSINDIGRALDEITEAGTVRTAVFTSGHEKNWCTGLDIGWIMEQFTAGSQAPVKKLFIDGTRKVFRRMLTMPMVTIAAVNGHAWGNGVVFAMLCDFRFMREDRGYFCLPEVDMGLTDAFSPSSRVLFNKRFGTYIDDVMIPTGRRIAAEELLSNGIIDRKCHDRQDVLTSALEYAGTIGNDSSLHARLLKDREAWSVPVIKSIDNEDENRFDFMIGRFWKLMEKMKGK